MPRVKDDKFVCESYFILPFKNYIKLHVLRHSIYYSIVCIYYGSKYGHIFLAAAAAIVGYLKRDLC